MKLWPEPSSTVVSARLVVSAIAHHVGMQMAIGYVGALSLVIAFVATRTRLLK